MQRRKFLTVSMSALAAPALVRAEAARVLRFIPQTDANLTDADLTGAIWNGVDLSGACLTGAALSGAHQLTQTQLDQAYGKPATCRRA